MDGQGAAFLLAVTLLSLSPGVDTLLVIRNTLRGGFIEGAITSLAIGSGLFVHATVSALGVSLLLSQSTMAFAALKLTGAGYLVWLGAGSVRAASGVEDGLVEVQAPTSRLAWRSRWKPFKEGLLSNVLNPKTVIFYMAFLPQFISAEDPVLIKSLGLASIHFLIANLWQLGLAYSVLRALDWLADPQMVRWIHLVTGVTLITMGVFLALESPA